MQMIYCPNCGKLTGFKRSLGFGSLFLVLITCGLWLLVIPFYPARCITCGLTRHSAVVHNFLVWYRGLSPTSRYVIVGLFVVLLVFNALRKASSGSGPVALNTTTSSATPQDTQTLHSGEVPEDHELHLTPNLFGRGAVSDGRTYSVALISSYERKIPPATTLFAQGIILGRFDTNVIVLADEQERSKKLLCSMSPDESENVRHLYHSGEVVQVTGGFGMVNLGVPILSDCTVASPTERVVRPLSTAPATAQSIEEPQGKDENSVTRQPASHDSASNSGGTVEGAVFAWANAFRSKNTRSLAASYAPMVEQYFRKKNVSREQIQGNIESAFARMNGIRTYDVSGITIQMLPTEGAIRAAATFRKTWEITQVEGKTFSGEEIEKLTFKSSPEGWQIVREEELQIIRASKSTLAETKPVIADRPIVQDRSSAPSALPELGQLEQRRESLEARAISVSTDLHELQQSQTVQGRNLPGEIVASKQRMQARLYEAKSALKEQDVSRARECLDRAETEVVNLEKFLGH